nr:MAG TPA: tail protein [Caudoviricetes sp.]
MQLNIHNSTLKRVGFINNNLPNALHYFDDNWHRYLAEGTSTFDFSVNKVNPTYALLTLQSYISFTYDGEDYLFNIINIEQDHYSMHLQCENLNLELISEEVGAYGNTKRHSIVWYLKNVAKITDDFVEIGNNPFPIADEDTSNPILSFDSTDTKLARIISICNSFNAEFQFKTQLKNDGTLHNITIDLYKEGGVGQKRKDVILYYGKNIAGITSKADRTSTFFNATTVTDSKKKYNWLSVEGKHYNSNGQLEFYKDAGNNTAYAPLSRDMFPSQLKSASSDRYTRKDLSFEATSANSLWDYAVSQFKLYAYPQMTYEVSVAVNAVTSALGNDRKLDIGDTIIVQDKTFDKSEGGLILSARVSEQEISFTNPHNNKITFTNFVRLKSDISADLYGRMKDLVEQNTPYKAEVETTNGLQFKNGEGSTTLTARIYFGSDSTEAKADSYSWTKDGTFVADVQEITVDASGIDGKAVYVFKAVVNDKVVGTGSVTITNVNDGKAGKPGTDGRSVTGIEQKYQVTETAVIPADSWENEIWLSTIPKMTATNKYLWSITRTTFNQAPLTQDIVEQKAVYGDSGEDGSDGDPGKIVSDEEPTTKFKGLTWKYIGITAIDASDGTNIQPNTEYYWNGNHWMVNYLSVNNIEANSITADLINAKNLTITDGEFVSKTTQGFVTISTEIKDNHISISNDDSASDILNSITLDPEQGLAMAYLNRQTGDNRGVGVNFQGLFTHDNAGNYAQLTPQGTKLSTDVPWTTLSATGGFHDGAIQFSVQNGVAYFSVTNLITPAMTGNKWYQCAQLPTSSSAIPSVNRVTTAFSNNSTWGFYVATTGGLYFKSFTSVSVTNNSTNVLAAFPIG